MESIWSKHTKIPPRPPLTKSIRTQAAVIGGGLTGVLLAYYLEKHGVETVILEADRIGQGQTKNTTAKITIQHGLFYTRLAEQLGIQRAKQYADAGQQALAAYRTIIKEKQIECRFRNAPAYLYTLKNAQALEKETIYAQKLGIDAVFTDQTELPFAVAGAVKFEKQAQFDPLAFLNAVAQPLCIFEKTKATEVSDNHIQTENATVKADHIIFACHYPFINMPGYYFMRMHQERSYVLALQNAPSLQGMYLGIDSDDAWSLRSAGDLLLLGGGKHRTGENKNGGQYQALLKKAAALFPGSTPYLRWSAQDCITLDGLPYIGRFSSSRPNWYVATGYQKWGMTNAMVAAILLCGLITQQPLPCTALFSPRRFTPRASAKSFLNEGAHAIKGLSRQLFTTPRTKSREIPPGHGGIAQYQGKKRGVYRTSDGKTVSVSTRCPHLGCQLEWNPEEKSWDCPCHGSRFDHTGHLQDGPAQEDLSNEE